MSCIRSSEKSFRSRHSLRLAGPVIEHTVGSLFRRRVFGLQSLCWCWMWETVNVSRPECGFADGTLLCKLWPLLFQTCWELLLRLLCVFGCVFQVHTKFHCRQAHAAGSDTTCLAFSYDGVTLASRGGQTHRCFCLC